jgi:hypothetical protein
MQIKKANFSAGLVFTPYSDDFPLNYSRSITFRSWEAVDFANLSVIAVELRSSITRIICFLSIFA